VDRPGLRPRSSRLLLGRVLETPSCRWSQYVCIAAGVRLRRPELGARWATALLLRGLPAGHPGAGLDLAHLVRALARSCLPAASAWETTGTFLNGRRGQGE
jgi:hypothetical protein